MASYRTNDNLKLQLACVDSANYLIELCELSSPNIASISDINSNLFIALFEKITGSTIPDLFQSSDVIAEVYNVQAVIDTLSLDLLGLSLSHISGENVVSCDPLAVLNLLEVLEAVFLQLFPQKKCISPKRRKVSTSSESLVRQSSSQSLVSERVRVVQRKVCKRTLKKRSQEEVSDVEKPSTLVSVKSQEHNPESHLLPPLRQDLTDAGREERRTSECCVEDTRHPTDDDVKLLYDSNLEKKVRSILLGEKSPRLRCQQLKRNYLQSLRAPMKRKSIPVCRKSFLLPPNLRQGPNHRKPSKNQKRKVFQKVQSEVCGTSLKQGKTESKNDPSVIFGCLLKEFPGFEFPSNSAELLRKQYYHHLSHMHKQLRNTLLKKPTMSKQIEEAYAKQSKLSNILSKDLEQKQHLEELKAGKASANRIKCSLRDARMRSIKLRQYFDEFHTSMAKKMQQRNFAEELIVEKTFKEMLDLQKEEIRLLCKRVKETNEQDAKQHRQFLEALQNIYEQQMELITESLNIEQKEELEQEKEKNGVTRRKLQRDVHSLQKDVLGMMKDTHFRELDANNFWDWHS